MKKFFQRFLLLVVVVILGVAWQQYHSFNQQRLHLVRAMETLQPHKKVLQTVFYERETFRQQLQLAEKRYAQLRTLIPVEEQTCEFQGGVNNLASKYGLKILAQKHSVISKSFYREIHCAYTLEGRLSDAQKLIAQIGKSPRLLSIGKIEPTDEKHNEVTITMYTMAAGEEPVVPATTCEAPPGDDIIVPDFKQRLDAVYSEYQTVCQFVADNADLYADLLLYRYLREQNEYIGRVVEQLRTSKH